ncbi:vomeronasal type-2 receptor 116-like [Tenrec ecaudatus]|uniref:vomeronasal type-2 receptor 116-like n=1 Tax=Tenrec ecaudatus TaxID=94439 RepID=UPI003F590347
MSFKDCFDYVQPSVYRDGDLVLGGFFPLYKLADNSEAQWKFFVTSPRQNGIFHMFNFQNYGYALIFRFAVEEINRNPLVLPNISLGVRLYNAFPSVVRTLESVLGWLSDKEPPIPNYTCQSHTKNMAVIAGIPSEFLEQAGALLDLYRTPQTPHSVCSNSCDPGFMKVTQKGKPICCFDCISCPEGEISNQTESDTCMECPHSQYPNMERNRCLPKMVVFLAHDDPLGMALACTALGFSVITAVVLWVFVKHRDSPMVKANNRALSYVLLLSLLLCFFCSLLFIGRPDTATCILQQITFAVVFTVAVSAVLAKTITVILAFKALTPGRTMRRLLLSGASNAVVPICSMIQLIICGVWLGTSPPFVDTDTHSEPRNIIIVCNKGSVTAFYCVLGFLGFLALGTFFLAYQARNLPDTFNEAKFLTFSMLVFCSVWVTFLPVYHSTQGKLMVAVEIFSILASSLGLLGCIFAPKCYVIFLHPDRNTSKGLRNKTCFEEK